MYCLRKQSLHITSDIWLERSSMMQMDPLNLHDANTNSRLYLSCQTYCSCSVLLLSLRCCQTDPQPPTSIHLWAFFYDQPPFYPATGKHEEHLEFRTHSGWVSLKCVYIQYQIKRWLLSVKSFTLNVAMSQHSYYSYYEMRSKFGCTGTFL